MEFSIKKGMFLRHNLLPGKILVVEDILKRKETDAIFTRNFGERGPLINQSEGYLRKNFRIATDDEIQDAVREINLSRKEKNEALMEQPEQVKEEPKEEPPKHILAVYGTLKEGYGNNRLIKSAGLTALGTAYSEESSFYMTGEAFPIVYKNAPKAVSSQFGVELYGFNTEDQLNHIDALEGHPNWYKREEINFINEDGEVIKAFTYLQDYEDLDTARIRHSSARIKITENVANWNY